MYDATTSSGISPSVVVRFHPSSPTTLSTVRACRSWSSWAPRHPRIPETAGIVPERELHHPIGAHVGEGIDQDAVDDAEDGARGAYPEGQREDRGEREPWAAAQFPRRITKIGDDRAHIIALTSPAVGVGVYVPWGSDLVSCTIVPLRGHLGDDVDRLLREGARVQRPRRVSPSSVT